MASDATVLFAPAGKRCTCCDKVHPLTHFGADKTRNDGKRSDCRSCVKKADAKRWASSDERRERSKQQTRKHRYRTAYGITIEQYETLLQQQGGVCAICEKPEVAGRSLQVDHCHNSNVIRGLLCGRCNGALGLFQDSRELVESALRYVLRGEGKAA